MLRVLDNLASCALQLYLSSQSSAGGFREATMLEWQKPVVVEQEVGLEVTSYSSAEIDPTEI